MTAKAWDRAADATLLLTITLFLLSVFSPELLFLPTVVTGGDTASHFQSAAYLRDYLLPRGRITGWFPGNYGGFPLFLFYFPLLFVLAALADRPLHLLPLEESLKLACVLGPFILPLCTYAMLRAMRLPFPAPALGAGASVLFLLNDSNSMWGGNILSTLAGEFSYGVSFALCFLLLGILYRLTELVEDGGLEGVGRWFLSGTLSCAAMGMTHGFTIIAGGLSAVFFLLSPRRWLLKAVWVGGVFAVGLLLLGPWLFPLAANLPYTTGFNLIWTFGSIREVLPPLFMPLQAVFLAGTAWTLARSRRRAAAADREARRAVAFAWWVIGVSVVSFFCCEALKIPDIRLLPFIQYVSTVFGAAMLGRLFTDGRLDARAARLAPLLLLFAILFATAGQQTTIRRWANWNFGGFENAPGWPVFRRINDLLKGSPNDPRVVYEHNVANEQLGSLRAFESLPYFSGRSTLEGLYFQSSLLSPAVFYLQSLISEQISCPFPDYPCSSLDLERAAAYLRLFDVRDLIAVSDTVKVALRALPERYARQPAEGTGDYELWRLAEDRSVAAEHGGGYVEALREEPEAIEPGHFRERFYRWLRGYSDGKRMLYTLPEDFMGVHGLRRIPFPRTVTVAPAGDCRVSGVELGAEELSFSTECLGSPHLVKVAYNPGWKVEGAQGPYIASPGFLMVYPTSRSVTLRFDDPGPRRVGWALFYLGLGGLAVFAGLALARRRLEPVFARIPERADRFGHRIGMGALALGFVALGALSANPGPQRLFKRYEADYTAKRYRAAERGFEDLIRRWPEAPNIERIYYYLAISYYASGDCPGSEAPFAKLAAFADSQYVAEARYHLGMCAARAGRRSDAFGHWEWVAQSRSASEYWKKAARDRLSEAPRVPGQKPRAGI